MTAVDQAIVDLWDFDDPAGSEKRFRAQAQADRDHAEIWLTQVARALSLRGKFDDAHEMLDKLSLGDPRVRVRACLERGRVYRSAGEPDHARPFFEYSAAHAAEHSLQALRIDALHMLALVVEPAEAVAVHQAALELARAATDEAARNWDASLLNNLGMVHADAGDFDAALVCFNEAVVARERIGDPERTRVARWMVAWALRNLGRTQEALAQQLALKAELDAAGASDRYVNEELALLQADDS